MTSVKIDSKRLFLERYTDSDQTIQVLLRYTENRFVKHEAKPAFGNSAQLRTYQQYVEKSVSQGAFNILQSKLVQLQFPVKNGISQTEGYKNVTLRGKPNTQPYELHLIDPDGISLEVYISNLIGKVPVLKIPNDTDFATLVCALSNRNEPRHIPQSMGASFINGINNWDRIYQLKRIFQVQNPHGNWSEEFRRNILPFRELYQDQLILLSAKPYSNVSSEVLGLDKRIWKSYSLKIRLDHECAHLFTLKHYGQIANNLHDEVIADYVGISSALGIFNSSWFLFFMGMENFPNYREGGRLQNYTNQLSDDAFKVLQIIVKQAAENIAFFDQFLNEPKNVNDGLNRIKSICECGLLNMAMDDGVQNILKVYESFQQERV